MIGGGGEGGVQWSRGSHAAQLFMPSGSERFGRRAMSRGLRQLGIQMPVKMHWLYQSAPIPVFWGLDSRSDRSRNQGRR